jgi:hypothetical protein
MLAQFPCIGGSIVADIIKACFQVESTSVFGSWQFQHRRAERAMIAHVCRVPPVMLPCFVLQVINYLQRLQNRITYSLYMTNTEKYHADSLSHVFVCTPVKLFSE